jgi:hypothetical protein
VAGAARHGHPLIENLGIDTEMDGLGRMGAIAFCVPENSQDPSQPIRPIIGRTTSLCGIEQIIEVEQGAARLYTLLSSSRPSIASTMRLSGSPATITKKLADRVPPRAA